MSKIKQFWAHHKLIILLSLICTDVVYFFVKPLIECGKRVGQYCKEDTVIILMLIGAVVLFLLLLVSACAFSSGKTRYFFIGVLCGIALYSGFILLSLASKWVKVDVFPRAIPIHKDFAPAF